MKTSVISPEFRSRYLENPADPQAFEGRAIVFEGPEDYHERINDPALEIDADCILFIRGTGPVGYPGAAEVVNMLPPDALVRQGITLASLCGVWPAVGHFGESVDSERIARVCGGRWPCAAYHGRSCPD